MVAIRVIPSCVSSQCRRIVLPPLSHFGRRRCAHMFIHQSGPCTISVSLVLLRLFLSAMFWFVVDPAVVVDFYYQEFYSVCLCCSRGKDILTNVIIMSLTSAPPILVLLWLLNCEYWVSSTYLRMCFMYIILTSNCIAWEFDYFMLKLNMLWWCCCYFLGFVHFSSHPNLLCLIQSCSYIPQ